MQNTLKGILFLVFLTSQLQADISSRIIGGENAPAGQYRFQVSLQLKSNKSPFCGGVLINNTTVVTAAHCVKNDFISQASQIEVLANTQDLLQGGQRIEVRSFVAHPHYNKFSENDFDIAVIKMKPSPAQAKILNGIPKAQLASSLPGTGTAAWVSGWGTISTESTIIPRKLQHVGVKVTARAICQEAYSGAITGRMLCAGVDAGGKDACQGDSGGPLVTERRVGSKVVRDVLVGIVSWGESCALAEFPGVYVNVAQPNVRNWIVQNSK